MKHTERKDAMKKIFFGFLKVLEESRVRDHSTVETQSSFFWKHMFSVVKAEVVFDKPVFK